MPMAPLSVSIVACLPPELFAPAGTFGLPGGALQPAIHTKAAQHNSHGHTAERPRHEAVGVATGRE